MVGSAAAFGAILSTMGLKADEPATAKIKRLLIDIERRDDGIYCMYLHRDGSIEEELLVGIYQCCDSIDAEYMKPLPIQPRGDKLLAGV